MNVDQKYSKLIRNLTQACKMLDLTLEVPDNQWFDLDDGVLFTIDDVPYFVATTASNDHTEWYYAAAIVTQHNYPHEPDTQDEAPINCSGKTHGNETFALPRPELLVGVILRCVMDRALDNVMETLVWLDAPESL